MSYYFPVVYLSLLRPLFCILLCLRLKPVFIPCFYRVRRYSHQVVCAPAMLFTPKGKDSCSCMVYPPWKAFVSFIPAWLLAVWYCAIPTNIMSYALIPCFFISLCTKYWTSCHNIILGVFLFMLSRQPLGLVCLFPSLCTQYWTSCHNVILVHVIPATVWYWSK